MRAVTLFLAIYLSVFIGVPSRHYLITRNPRSRSAISASV